MGDDFYKELIKVAPMGYAYNRIICNSRGEPYDFDIIDVNDTFIDLTGIKALSKGNIRFSSLFPNISMSQFSFIKAYGDIALNGGSIEFDEFIEPLGTWFHIKAVSNEKGFFITWLTEISKERLIARISQDFLQIKDQIDYQRIADYILGISEAYYAFFYLFDDSSNIVRFKASSGFKNDPDQVSAVISLIMTEKFNNYSNKYKNQSLTIYRSLKEFADSTDISSRLSNQYDNMPKGEVVTVKLNNDSKLLGVFVLIMPENKSFVNHSIIFLYTRQVGLLLTRNKAQQDMLDANNKLLESNNRLEKAEEVAHIGNWEYDCITQNMIWSKELYRICGINPAKFSPNLRNSYYLIHPEDRVKVKRSIEKAFRNRALYDLESRIIRPDGEVRWVLLKGFIACNEADSIIKISGSVLDITESKHMENALIQEKERLRITLLSVGDGVIVVDKTGMIEMMNDVACRLTGYTTDESVGMPFKSIFNIIHEYTRERYANPVNKVINSGSVSGLTNHMLLISKDGKETPVAYNAAPIKDKTGEITGVVLVLRDITEEKENQKEILYLSFHDQLTGLYNRSYFDTELERLDKPRNYPLSIIISDVNGLKLTNDAFGHAIGDKLLKKAAEIIKSQCRSDDILVRLGGDEFAILLPRTGEAEVEKIVKRMRAAISNVTVDSVMLSVSIGWAVKTSQDQDINRIIQKADDYMYRRKLFESPSMRGKTLHAMLNTLHEKNMRERKHSERVSYLCEEIARAMGLTEEKVDELKTVGLMHDIGKIAIDEAILNKKGMLLPEEQREIQRHPEIGYRILSSVNAMSEMAEYVLAHHERWDGLGYPKGLKGDDIPLEARIIAVADAFDAMISERPYRRLMDEQEAIAELERNKGIQFDEYIVSLFLNKVLKAIV